jgi:asparagine synthase (glutamine-hydrolysing)
MPGFLGTIGPSLPKGFAPETRIKLLQEHKAGENWYVERRTIRKFLDDKVFSETDDFIIVTEGVILNKKELEFKYGYPDNFIDCIISMYKKNGETFFNDFRGSFSGLIYDKKKDIWIIYTNHIGDKQVFYTKYRDTIIFGSEPGFVVESCKLNGIPLSLNEEASWMLLTYGFFIENHTLAKEIKKLTAGHYLKIINGQITEIQYHRFSNEPNYQKSLNEWIEGIDHYFRKAIKMQFDKDLEYGYKHITTLSGGLDSRMTVWVAHQMGYTEQLNTTFSQSNYLDETIAKKIATDLKHEWLFKALDHGNFLKNIDDITRITYGGGLYAGLAHGKSMYDLINTEPFGIMHTGQIGDAIIGTFYKKPIPGTPHKIGDGAYSLTLIERLKNYRFIYDYPNEEIFALYSRAFTGADQGLLVFQEYTESVSPFTDVDFLEYCYTIPVELRYRHKIYIDWILNNYKESAKYKWESIHKIITQVNPYATINIFGRNIEKGQVIKWFLGAIKRRLSVKIYSQKNTAPIISYHMNPIDYWITTNSELVEILRQFFVQNIYFIKISDLKEDCNFLFHQGTSGETLQVITFLAGLKSYFTYKA